MNKEDWYLVVLTIISVILVGYIFATYPTIELTRALREF